MANRVGPVHGNHDLAVGREDLYELARAVLGQGASFTFVASGVSMLPSIRGGDRLTIVPCGGEDLRRGDVAFYVGEGGGLMAHRFLGRSRDGITLLMRGDGVWRVPERIPPARVLGRVSRVERSSGRRCTLGRRSRLAGMLWHGLFPYPLWAYTRLMRLRQQLARQPSAADMPGAAKRN